MRDSVRSMVAFVAVALAVLAGCGPGKNLTQDERAGLVLSSASGTPRLRHPFLGFSMAVPAGLEEVTGAAIDERLVTSQTWKDEVAKRVLMVLVSTAHTQKQVGDLLDGARDVEAALRPAGTPKVLRDETVWEGARREVHRRVVAGDVEVHTDTFVTTYAGDRELSTTIVSIGRAGDAIHDVAGSFVAKGG
jgi:hypothetical protein